LKKNNFRNYKSYEVGAGRIRIQYEPLANAPFGNEYLGKSQLHLWQHTIPSDWKDAPTLEILFHEMIDFELLRTDLRAFIPEDNGREAICTGLGKFLAEVARRNPDFWTSLSLKGD